MHTRTTVAVLGKKRQDIVGTAVTMLQVCVGTENAEAYGLASTTTCLTAKSLGDLANAKLESPTAVGYSFSRILDQDRLPQPRLENAAFVFSGRDYAHPGEDTSKNFGRLFRTGREQSAKDFIRNCKGDFLFVIAKPEELVAGRDTVGLRPLYYGENAFFAALASEKKALWKIGITQPKSFPTGCIGCADQHGFRFEPIKQVKYLKPTHMTLETAAKGLQKILESSIKNRVAELKEVGIAFSGGLDSSIIALIAKKSRANVYLVHVALENQHETEHALQAAEELELPLWSQTYAEKDVQRAVPVVLKAIEEPDPIKMSIAIPLFWTAKKARERDCRILLAGQGADELFGGYKRYVDDYVRFGEEKTRQSMFKDVAAIHEANLERDWKACNVNDVELRLPFAAPEIIQFALSLPLGVKLEQKKNTLRKLVLRQVAKNLGLPSSIADKPKKAIQYTTGVNKSLGKLAEREGLSAKEYIQKSFQKIFSRDFL